MTKEKLLFVTRGGEDCDNGFTYILELAKTLNAGIAMLMVYNKNVMQTYEDVMAAVAFAEAGEIESAREMLRERKSEGSHLRKTTVKEKRTRLKAN